MSDTIVAEKVEIKGLWAVRNISLAIRDFEDDFKEKYGLCLNESLLLCLLYSGACTSGAIARQLGLSHSNTSKVIRTLEAKGCIERSLGQEDKRQMYFEITEAGLCELVRLKEEEASVSALLDDIRCGCDEL